MARHNISSFSCDYICSECGNITVSFNKVWSNSKKYSVESMYCDRCKQDTDFIKLGDRYLVKSYLESYDYDDLDDVEQFVLNLFNMEELRKTK